MKFDFCIGNPPYQGENHQQIYTDFYLAGRNIADSLCLIFPIGWQDPKTANNLGKLNKQEIKTDRQIIFIDNRHNVFPNVPGAEWTNILLWRRGYDNKLNGKQLVYTNGQNPEEKKILWDKFDIKKPKEIAELAQIVMSTDGFESMQEKTSVLKPYGLRTDVFEPRDKNGNPVTVMQKYGLPELQLEKENNDDIKVLGLYNRKLSCRYVPKNYPFSKKTDCIDKYKIFVPYAWGNMSETAGLGGAYANIIIAIPNEICTEVFQESGKFDDVTTAIKHAKYMMTKFFRALLFMNKYSQHSTTAYSAIPVQDFSEEWWTKSIAEIDEHLFEKYNIPENIRKFVRDNIQTRTEENIVNFKFGNEEDDNGETD